ncbi:hypothetical protein OJAV_G00034950 [Oryzias javanicus]|uniref:Uncharacterized protein n=1 Tax=Oryzias javanicus TaxID=123683 RepID=A0A3S2MTB3_ORYJA|nr:hypothetical protein OJAV_G00034950 [Oryzias javanicus]
MLLRKDLHQHTVALKFHQDPQNDIIEITANHKREVKALANLLDETFAGRETLAKQLLATEKKMEATRPAGEGGAYLQTNQGHRGAPGEGGGASGGMTHKKR